MIVGEAKVSSRVKPAKLFSRNPGYCVINHCNLSSLNARGLFVIAAEV